MSNDTDNGESTDVGAAHFETSDWQGLRDDPLCARARKLLSFEEVRAIMRHARNYEMERFGAAMTEVLEYFEQRADIIDNDGGPQVPNEEMRLAAAITAALSGGAP